MTMKNQSLKDTHLATNSLSLLNLVGEKRWNSLLERHPHLKELVTFKDQIVLGLGLSDFISSACHQSVSILTWLFADNGLNLTQIDFEAELTTSLKGVNDETSLHKVIRLFRQRHMVRIAWRDLTNKQDIQDSLNQVSQLADCLITKTYEWLHCHILKDNSDDVKPLLILGMGKLGGQELNFSSDIDLIFLCNQAGEISVKGKLKDCSQLYTRLAQKLIKALDMSTMDGRVFRVDMRLRPYGESGPLVMSVDAFEEYLQDQGRDWERFALMKARLINPNSNNAFEFEELIRPFVYRKYLDFGAIESLRKMKQLISQEVRRKQLIDNIKLGSGGIRDIEFIVQSIQLIQGGKNASIRFKNLLASIKALRQFNFMEQTEFVELKQAYLYLRKAEHSIQQFADSQTQTLPSTPHGQASLTCSLGLSTYTEFLNELNIHLSRVQAHFSDLISENPTATQNDQNTELADFWLCVCSQSSDKLLGDVSLKCNDKFSEIFNEVSQFKHALLSYRPGTKGIELLDKLLPQIIGKVVERPESKNRLSNLSLLTRILPILKAIVRRTSYLQMIFENRGVIDQLIKLCEASPWIAHQITSFPLLLDELLDPMTLQQPPDETRYNDLIRQYLLRVEPDDMELQLEVLRQFKLSHQLRVAVADISGLLPIEKVSDQLTALAQACLSTSIVLAWQQMEHRYGCPDDTSIHDMGIGVIGYGKLGGIELGYGSDLDLVFIHDDRGSGYTNGEKAIEARRFYAKLVQRVMHIMTVKTSSGILYEVDLRLRPSGNSGLIVCSTQGYNSYLMEEAWTWEQQALVRARFIYGSPTLENTFLSIRRDCLARARSEEILKREIIEMREKMSQNQLSKGDDLKHARGGLIDIEFLVQFWVLNFSSKHPALALWTDNLRILSLLADESLVERATATSLTRAYTTMRAHIHHCTLAETTLVIPPEIGEMITFVEGIWKQVFELS